jgi:hypothetical protein
MGRKIAITSVLLLISTILLALGVEVDEFSQTRDVTEATFYVGAAVVFAISLIPWIRQ